MDQRVPLPKPLRRRLRVRRGRPHGDARRHRLPHSLLRRRHRRGVPRNRHGYAGAVGYSKRRHLGRLQRLPVQQRDAERAGRRCDRGRVGRGVGPFGVRWFIVHGGERSGGGVGVRQRGNGGGERCGNGVAAARRHWSQTGGLCVAGLYSHGESGPSQHGAGVRYVPDVKRDRFDLNIAVEHVEDRSFLFSCWTSINYGMISIFSLP